MLSITNLLGTPVHPYSTVYKHPLVEDIAP